MQIDVGEMNILHGSANNKNQNDAITPKQLAQADDGALRTFG